MDEFATPAWQPVQPATRGEILRQAAAAPWLYPRFCYTLASQMTAVFGSRLGFVLGPMRRIKLVKRFLRGAHLGWLLARYLLADKGPLPPQAYPLYGELFGFWGVAIIATDYVVDTHMADSRSAHLFLEKYLEILHDRDFSWESASFEAAADSFGLGRKVPSPEAEFLALGLGRLLKGRVEELRGAWPASPRWNVAWHHAEEDWLGRTRDLLAGQWRSLGQFHLTATHNWKWYCEEVLNQKTLNFFLAPLALYCLTSEAINRYEVLEKSFLWLNSFYLHWQLMDDLGDLIEDTRHGLVTSPGFILLSQGQLAAKIKPISPSLEERIPGQDNENMNILKELVNSILESKLITGEFGSVELHRDLEVLSNPKKRGPSLEALVNLARKCTFQALANLPSEYRLSLPELCARRITQKERYISLLKSGETDLTVAAVLESGTASRIIRTARDPERRAALRARWPQSDDPDLGAVLRLLYRLMHRAGERAVTLVQARGPRA